jgi:transcriptional regulator with XRE-family HTH domain
MGNLQAFAKYLREIRLNLMLSIDSFAKLTELNHLTIWKLERGKVYPSFKTMRKLRVFSKEHNLPEFEQFLHKIIGEAEDDRRLRRKNRRKDA